MPHGDVAAVLQDGFGLRVHRSTTCLAVERVARRGQATWHALRDAARRSMVNAIDETGWNVEAQLRWLWVVVSEQVTFCDIYMVRSPRRGKQVLACLLWSSPAWKMAPREFSSWVKTRPSKNELIEFKGVGGEVVSRAGIEPATRNPLLH
jgi:hypothetical protein